jgi:type II secretory pathway component PulJ
VRSCGSLKGSGMNRNRRNITHSIKVASIFKVVVSTAILAIAGLSYVYLKNQLQQYGEIQRRLEHELTEIRTANEAVRVQITQLSSRAVLEKKLAKNPLGLVPIASDQIVRLNQRHDGIGDELRVVSNRGFNQ